MSEDSSADWNLLPHRPVEFFGLAAGFDRQDLKRAYNRLLKLFKPDKCPAEFQKLRAAYEDLDASLRYGRPPQSSSTMFPVSGFNDPEITAAIDDPTTNSLGVPREIVDSKLQQREHLLAQLESMPASELYLELKNNKSSTPFDYFSLAILSDAVHEPSEMMFLNWLLIGIKKHPGEPALIRLLHTYLHSNQIEDADLPKVLVTISKIITTDRFYYFTETLLDRLCATASWHDFEQVLTTCRSNINDHLVRCSTVFTCHLLRMAAWRAPLASAERLLQYVEENAEYLGSLMEYELEFNTQLIEYIRVRERFVARGDLCRMIDHALRTFCLSPGDSGDREIIACQIHLSQHPEQLCKEFPFPADDDDARIASWLWACEEVHDRLETELAPVNPGHLPGVTLKLLQQIDKTFPASQLQLYNMVRVGLVCVGYGLSLSVAIAIFLTSLSFSVAKTKYLDAVTWMFVFLCVLFVIVFHFVIKPRTVDRWMASYLYRLVCRHYSDWWRPMIGRFHAATHSSFHDLRAASIQVIQSQHGQLNVSTWFAQLYSGDFAMLLYASAVRFLR